MAVSAVGLGGIQTLYTYTPFMNDVFDSAPLDGGAWVRIVAIAVISYLVIETLKYVQRAGELRRHR